MTISSTNDARVQSPATDYPVCNKCKKRMQNRVPRGQLVKTFLFWLPLKRYKCTMCGNKRYALASS